jgi:hypothetical protein
VSFSVSYLALFMTLLLGSYLFDGYPVKKSGPALYSVKTNDSRVGNNKEEMIA